MRFEELLAILASFNPFSYRRQIAVKQNVLFKRLFFALLLSLGLMLLVSVPLLVQFPTKIAEKTSSFDECSIGVSISTNQAVELSKIPLIVVDSNKTNASKEKILITNEGIIVNKRFSQQDRMYSWESLNSAQKIVEEHKHSIQIAVLLFLPSLLIALLIIAALETISLLIVSIFLTKVICVFTKKQMSFATIIKVVTLCLIPFFMVQIIPFFYARLWIIPLLIYVLFMTITTHIVSEGKEDSRKKRRSKSKKGSKHEIHFSEDKVSNKKNDESDEF